MKLQLTEMSGRSLYEAYVQQDVRNSRAFPLMAITSLCKAACVQARLQPRQLFAMSLKHFLQYVHAERAGNTDADGLRTPD